MSASQEQIKQAWATFAGLQPDDPATLELAQASHARQLTKGALLLKEADSDTEVFLLLSGALRTLRSTEQGQDVWFTDLQPGELIGEIAALINQPRSSDVKAHLPSVVLAISQRRFLEIASRHGAVGLAVARLLARRLARTSDKLAELVALSVPHRLHQELIRLSAPIADGQAIVTPNAIPSVTELGRRIHATREATSRALRDLELQGIIARSGDAWILADLTGAGAGD